MTVNPAAGVKGGGGGIPGPRGFLATMSEMGGLGRLAYLGFHALSQKFGSIVR